MKEKMMAVHRKFAQIAAVAVLLWGCSGLLHPLMSWTNPRAARFMPPVVTAFNIPQNAEVLTILRQKNIGQVQGLRVIVHQLQVSVPGEVARRYYDLADGAAIESADRDRAVMVARHYAGLKDAAILSTDPVTSFSNRYAYINRYLPVWRVSFNDPRHITAYVDTATDRLGALTDTRKVILQTLFQTVHTGQWLEGAEALRLSLIALLVGSALSVAVAGVYMLVRLRGPRKGVRRAHRVIAYAALFPLLMFPVSGLFHLFMQSPLLYGDHDTAPVSVDIETLAFMPTGKAEDLRLVSAAGTTWWRAQNGANTVYVDARSGDTVKGDENFVQALMPGRAVSKVTGYSDEYGFAYKRLPVWRVEDKGVLTFIEAKTAVIAATVAPLQVAETWSFSKFHKWQFLDGLSEALMGAGPLKNAARDVVMGLFMLLGLGMAVLGLMLRKRKV